MGLGRILRGVAKIALPVVGTALGGPLGGTLGKVGAGLIGSSGSKSAANALAAGNAQGINALTMGLNQARTDLAPYRAAGDVALNKLSALYNGDYSGFENSPDYQYALGESENAINRSAAARGNLLSGAAVKQLQRNGAGLASQNLGNYQSKLMQLAGLGSNAAGMAVNAGLGTAGNTANLLADTGAAKASGIVGSANNWASTAGDILGSNDLSDWFSKFKAGRVGGNGGGIVAGPTRRPSMMVPS